MSRIAAWVINWYLDHSLMYKRWEEEQEHTIRIQLHADKMIGQLP